MISQQFNLPGGGSLNCYYCNVYIDGKYQGNGGIGYPQNSGSSPDGWYPPSGGNQLNSGYPPGGWTPSGGGNPGIASNPDNGPYYPSGGPGEPGQSLINLHTEYSVITRKSIEINHFLNNFM